MPSDRGAVVVGAGLLGFAAAHALSRRGWRVTVLEAGEIGHAGAGSKGSARIFRLGYPDQFYVNLALEARRLWRTLETDSGHILFERTGQVTFGDAPALEKIASALDDAGVPAQGLSPGETAHRVRSMSLPAGPVLFEPDSGVLRADACLEALRATGDFTVQTGATVLAIDPGGPTGRPQGAAAVLSSGERFDADVVVNCAGHRAFALAGLHPPMAARPTLPQVAYFKPRHADDTPMPPVFIEWGHDMIYGLPVPLPVPGPGSTPGDPPLYKVSHHTPGETFEGAQPTDAELSAVDAPRLELLCAAVARLLPGLDSVPVASERCVYDNSVDTDFVIDRVGNVVIGCGTSGHAFKFGPILGVLLADLAEGVTPSVDITRFAFGRPQPPHDPAVPDGTAR